MIWSMSSWSWRLSSLGLLRRNSLWSLEKLIVKDCRIWTLCLWTLISRLYCYLRIYKNYKRNIEQYHINWQLLIICLYCCWNWGSIWIVIVWKCWRECCWVRQWVIFRGWVGRRKFIWTLGTCWGIRRTRVWWWRRVRRMLWICLSWRRLLHFCLIKLVSNRLWNYDGIWYLLCLLSIICSY
jgi:hypothetical protein